MPRNRNKEEWPKVDIMLTWRERDLLVGEPSDLWQIYYLVSSHRDFSTNIAGDPYRMSDRTFKECLEVTSDHGRKKRKLQTNEYRRMLERLEKKGLIENRGNYVFYLPLAHIGKSGLKQTVTKSVTNTVTKSVTKTDNEKSEEIQGLSPDLESELSPKLEPKLEPKPVYTSEEDLPNKTSEEDLTDLDHRDLNNIVRSKKISRTSLRFDEFVAVYPKQGRKNLKKAREKWEKLNLDTIADLIIAKVKLQAEKDRQWLEGFIPHITTYINGARWNDEIDSKYIESAADDDF